MVVGVVFGDFIVMIVFFVGLGVFVMILVIVFMVFKWVGVVYFFYFGVKLFLSVKYVDFSDLICIE